MEHAMRILHTSDWHLGRSLYGRKRYEEFEAFLNWLAETIESESADALLVAGDVFDTGMPSNRVQQLYYRFLCRVTGSCCRHVVVIAGNHDSPSFLNAPRELLKALNVHVVGACTEDPAQEVIVLENGDVPELVVCAVPYLRERDIRTLEPGETIDDRNARLVDGLRRHYRDVCDEAEARRADFESAGHSGVPIAAMGHLFTAEGKTVDGDGVRELYVGSLAHVDRDMFPACIDYLALGHLHVPQTVGGCDHLRYSGSPIPMGFGEAGQRKTVVLVDFSAADTGSGAGSGKAPAVRREVRPVPVPCFQELVSVAGDTHAVRTRLEELIARDSRAWLEIEYTGTGNAGALREMVDECVAGTALEVRRIRNRRVMDRVLGGADSEESLDDLEPEDVFVRCMDAFEVPDEERAELNLSYREILVSLHDQDVNAE